MPGEDTNELMKLRAVQGELMDLPEDNPRATLSSRIHALLLRMTGIPQLIHLYGTLALNKTLTLDTNEDECRSIFSDGTYLYVGLRTSPAKIVKIDLSDFTCVTTINLGAGTANVHALVSDGEYLYAGLSLTPGKVVKIRLVDLEIVDTITLTGSQLCHSLFCDGSYLYAGTGDSPANIYKIDLLTFTIDANLTLNAGEDACYAIISDGSHLYATCYTNPGQIVKIEPTGLTRVTNLTFDAGENKCHHLISDGTFLYAGLNTAPAKIVKIDLYNFIKVDVLTLDAAEDYVYSLYYDGTHLYAGLYTTPSEIAIINLITFTKKQIITTVAGENRCRVLFSDGTYLYGGLYTTPGKVFRRYILPTNATLRERKIDRIHERNVEQSMPTSFYGKVTTYTDTTHFKISNLSRFGNDFFKNWYVYVVRDSAGAGAAPQDELVKITDYTSSDGTFAHVAFTTPLALTDEVLIVHKAVAAAIACAAGRVQVLEVSVTSAANAAADTVIATVAAQPCLIEGVIIRANAVQTTDLSSCPIKGGTNKVLTFINAGNATQPNLDAIGKQITWSILYGTYLAVGEDLRMEHNGVGATALNLKVIIVYRATADGGHLA